MKKTTSIGGTALKQFPMDSIGSIKSTNGNMTSTVTLKKNPSSSSSASTKPKVSKPSSASSQGSTSSVRSNNSTIGKKIAPKAIEELYEQSQKNPVILKAKQKAAEACESVDKLAFETVVLEEELKKLKLNIMKDKEVRSTMPKQGFWKSSQKIREELSQTTSPTLNNNRPPSATLRNSISREGEQGKVIKIRSSITSLTNSRPSSSAGLNSSTLSQTVKTKPIPGTQYEEIIEFAGHKASAVSTETSTLNEGGSLLNGEYNEAEQGRLFQEALRNWRGDSKLESKIYEDDNSTSDLRGGKLREGNYDEQLQQKLFKNAVMSWRNGGTSDNSKREKCNAETESDQNMTNTERKMNGLSLFQNEFLEHLRNATRYTYFDQHFRK